MRTEEIIQSARTHGYYEDLMGLGSRAFPGVRHDVQAYMAARFVLRYEQMWHEVGNQDPVSQAYMFNGIHPLFSSPTHAQINLNLTPLDYLFTFKEFMRKWAARKHEISPQENWYMMQDEFALLVR